MEQALVRIKPLAPRERHVLRGKMFTKSGGWYKVTDASLIAAARAEPLHDLQVDSPKLFDVQDFEEAKATAASEQKRADPSGTPDQPRSAAALPESRHRRR